MTISNHRLLKFFTKQLYISICLELIEIFIGLIKYSKLTYSLFHIYAIKYFLISNIYSAFLEIIQLNHLIKLFNLIFWIRYNKGKKVKYDPRIWLVILNNIKTESGWQRNKKRRISSNSSSGGTLRCPELKRYEWKLFHQKMALHLCNRDIFCKNRAA